MKKKQLSPLCCTEISADTGLCCLKANVAITLLKLKKSRCEFLDGRPVGNLIYDALNSVMGERWGIQRKEQINIAGMDMGKGKVSSFLPEVCFLQAME